MKWLLMWLNVSVATLNATLQLLVIYRYVIYLNEETNEVIAIFFLIIKHVHSCLKTSCSDTMLNY